MVALAGGFQQIPETFQVGAVFAHEVGFQLIADLRVHRVVIGSAIVVGQGS